MLTNKLVPSALTLVILSSCLPCTAAKSYDDERLSTGAIVASVGAAVAGVGALIWSLQPDAPETVLSKSKATYHETLIKYQEAIDKIYRHDVSVRSLDETALYSCALAGVRNHCTYINSSIATVSDAINTTGKALQKTKNDSVYDDLCATLEKLRRLKRQLTEVEECLSVHKTYFDLFDIGAKLLNSHARELDTQKGMIHAHDGRYYLKDAINGCLNVRYSAHDADWKYPYLAYAKKIGQDIRDLEKTLSRTSSCYNSLIGEARNLLYNLQSLHTLVVNAPEYQHNLRAYEQERIERERFELEQARLRAEQARMQAEQQRAHAEQARARAERERVAIEYDRLRTEREHVEIQHARLHEERMNNLNNMRQYCTICAHEWYSMNDRCNCHCR